ncbi:MAG: HEAT repeat domain-containing protein [Deltaproteobacteria bacterium]|nr:HEAT repeat domain-containing protein [Deltaproteobacteria bacterium]
MPINNRLAIILFGIIAGAAFTLNLIGSQAFLLSVTEPIYTFHISIFSGISLSFFLAHFRLKKMKFATFSIFSIFIYSLALLLLILVFHSPFLKALIWFFLACYGIAFFRWIGTELVMNHLDPARSQPYFSYLASSFEIGALLVIIFLKLSKLSLTPDQMILTEICICLSLLFFTALQFYPTKNIEIKFSKKMDEAPILKTDIFKHLKVVFLVVSLGFGALKISEEYLVKLVLKQELHSFEAIKNMTMDYIFVASALVILASLTTGRLIQRKRVSPIQLFHIQIFSFLMVSVLALVTQSFYAFIFLEITKRVTENCLYLPSNQMILFSFVGHFRNKLRSLQSFFYYTVAGIPFFFILPYAQQLAPLHQRKFILGIILACLILVFLAVLRFRRRFIQTMYQFVEAGHKTAAIIAVQALSFLRPKSYLKKMKNLLEGNPKKLLRKTIILGLGYSQHEDSLENIMKEFRSDKEEIQIAVLDALSVSQQYGAVQFMINVILAQEKVKSLRVRLNATALLVNMYGKKAIPFLLNGLEDSDERLIANTLETLSLYNDKSLIPYFKKHLSSSNNRVKANAYMGLARFRSTYSLYLNFVQKTLKEQTPDLLGSVLYIIGQVKDFRFKKEVAQLSSSALRDDPMIKRCLAWALSQLRDPKGFDLFGELFETPFQKEKEAPFMHFFSQLQQEQRFDITKHLVNTRGTDKTFINNMGDHLRYSKFDFHEEIEYFHLIRSAQKKT